MERQAESQEMHLVRKEDRVVRQGVLQGGLLLCARILRQDPKNAGTSPGDGVACLFARAQLDSGLP